jgi:hypothetical protein
MKLLLFPVLLIGLTACAAKKLDLGPAAGAGPVTCDSPCAAEWERAQLWIVKHSKLKIQVATDVTIQTYNPPDQSTYFGFAATKEPVSEGKHRITLGVACVNLISCLSRPEDVKAAFYYYVASGTDILADRSAGGLR